MKGKYCSIIIISSVLILDQLSKIWIKTNMMLGEEIRITDWFIIHFVENPGMAFGLEFGGDIGKVALTVFRIIFVTFIFFYLRKAIINNRSKILISTMSFVLAGALGNIMDSIFYGVLFDDSIGKVASFLPEVGGYAPVLFGKVVDMLYFPLYKGFLPDWIPFFGGDYFVFFQPIFNIADTSISIGIGLFILFQNKFKGAI
ncbi:lipoprotein signal peptidase [Ichthyobacterium seriolicida]|uniref:Lipoprotein signal peptidase n=1 Tax=Ichthyobacterium seriolicida TaxID=242600 RepID=A0A1J1EBS3_9FLAO|nr:lipoprotein signal peptidase [Ichthyobacterium seriolicida]BAV94960.1 lipoprotein signal peptidase [Ichthyobacterium seriolicida]